MPLMSPWWNDGHTSDKYLKIASLDFLCTHNVQGNLDLKWVIYLALPFTSADPGYTSVPTYFLLPFRSLALNLFCRGEIRWIQQFKQKRKCESRKIWRIPEIQEGWSQWTHSQCEQAFKKVAIDLLIHSRHTQWLCHAHHVGGHIGFCVNAASPKMH